VKSIDTAKSKEDERIQLALKQKARIAAERKKMRALIKKTGWNYIDNGNDTVSDKRTGLMWCLLDAGSELGRCLEYKAADAYVKQLKTGGYSDWRLPTAKELVHIYKNKPFFPSTYDTWFWASEVIWHGWLEKAYVVSSKPETFWSKEEAELNKCGSVRAVRP